MPRTRSDSMKRVAELSDDSQILLAPQSKKHISCIVELKPLSDADPSIDRGKEIASATQLSHLEKLDQGSEAVDSKILSDSSDYVDSSDDDGEARVKKLLKERSRINRVKQDILKKLAIVKYTQEISGAFSKKKREKISDLPKKNLHRKFKHKKSSPSIKRQSLRLLKKDPNGIDLPVEPLRAHIVEENPRHPGTEFPMRAIGFEENSEVVEGYKEMEDYAVFMKSLTSITDVPDYLSHPTSSPTALQECTKELQKLSTKPEHILKVVKSRIFSLAFHPSVTEVLVAAGDKNGYLGLWRPFRQDANEGAYMFHPHSKPISCMKFSLHDVKLYTCSYDGQLRSMDLTRNVFDEAAVDDEDFNMSGFDFLEWSKSLIVSRTDGSVSVIDMRAPSKENTVNSFEVYNRAAKCVSCHPLQKHYISTSHRDGSVFIFDVRNLSKKRCKPLAELKGSKRSTSSAYFSPITGKHVLTTSYDNHLRIYDTSVIAGGQIALKSSCYHNNQTGRWLSSFRAVWHPRTDDILVVGSMNRPRQIDMYDDSARPLHVITDENLSTVCSVNCFHDSLNILASGNSSGRVYLFSDGIEM